MGPDTRTRLRSHRRRGGAGSMGVYAALRRARHALRERTQILEAIAAGTTDAVFVKDRRGRYLMINAVGARVFGMTPAEVVGRADAELFSVQSALKLAEREAAILEGGHPVTYESTSTTAGGATRVWLSTKAPCVGRDGRITGLVGVSRDITAQKRQEEAFRLLSAASAALATSLDEGAALAELLALLVPGVAEACVIHARYGDGELRRVAARAVPELDALAAEGSPGLHADLCVAVFGGGVPLCAEDLPEPARVALAAAGARSAVLAPVVARDTRVGCLGLFSSRPGLLEDAFDRGLALEIARRVGMALESARLYREAQEANRHKDEFLALVSHELRTPLTAILGWAQMARGRGAEGEVLHALAVIERAARGQARLIDDLMDGSRIMAGKLHLESRELDLWSVVGAAVEAARPVAETREIRLTAALGGEPAPVRGDASRLQQVVANLLSNALKFTPRGGAVEVLGRIEGGMAWLCVRDDGEGIPPDLLPRLFQRFRQADSSTSRRHGGLGLGLSIVRHLVEAHGGEVRAASAGPGLGAAFTVRLPLREAAAPMASAPPPRPEGPWLGDLLVLLVEDDPDALEVFRLSLLEHGARVIPARSAGEARACTAERRPDLVISDIGLPGEDGYALIRSLRARWPDAPPPAIALSAYTDAGHRSRAIAAGFEIHLAKPIDPLALASAAARLAARRRG